MLRSTDPWFRKFGEIYFSLVKPGYVKGWHLHKRKTLNYAIVSGQATLVLYDERLGSKTRGRIDEIKLRLTDYALVTVPPGLWNSLLCVGKEPALIANCATLPYDEKDIVRLDPFDNRIPYEWGKRKGGG